MVTSVTALLNTVKSVEDKAAKGSRALEQTINSIKQELKVSELKFFRYCELQNVDQVICNYNNN